MVRSVEAGTLTFIVLPSSNLILIVLRFGSVLLFVLLLAWLTLLPTIGPLPVKKHFLAIFYPYKMLIIESIIVSQAK